MADLVLLRAEFGLSVALLLIGAMMALTSSNVQKRVGGLLVVEIAALLAAGSLKAGAALMMAGVATGFAALLIGSAIVVRIQEAYGAIETPELDAADVEGEQARQAAQ